MPLFFQHTFNENTRLGVWKITEQEDFFLTRVPLQRAISHPHKRLQHLAGRYLLQHLFPDFPYELIIIADTRKPYLANEAVHFSISHCGEYAAAIVSSSSRVGVDVELVKPMIEKIQRKFLGNEEAMVLSSAAVNSYGRRLTHAELLTISWSAKEAIFKWYGKGEVDFKEHMQVSACAGAGNDGQGNLQVIFTKEGNSLLHVDFRVTEEFILAWMIH